MNAKRARSSRRGGGSCSVTAARNLEPCAGCARRQNPVSRRKPANVLHVREKEREAKRRRRRRREEERKRDFYRGLFALFDAVAILWHAWCSLPVLRSHGAGSCPRRGLECGISLKDRLNGITRLAFTSLDEKLANQFIVVLLEHVPF